MAISITKYVDIISGVGAGAVVRRRELIGRLFTTNPLVPTKTLLEFLNPDDVGDYFGTSSVEYLRAVFYFGFISKNISAPKKLGFYRWTNADTAPKIFGSTLTLSLAALKLITAGAISLTIGGVTHVLTGIDFSGAVSLAGIATILETEINAADVDPQWADATVVYDASRASFDFVGGQAVADAISATVAGSGTEIISSIGWLASAGAIFSNGKLAESITTVLTESTQLSDNFGSFLFIPTFNLAQTEEAATWNNAKNVLFQYMSRVLAADASSWSAALDNYAGIGLTLAPLADEYPEQAPMMILAATDYSKRNITQNYMYYQFNLTPSVTTDTDAALYDGLRINYYGVTQTAGQYIAFYQDGVLMGLPTAPLDMNTYANEQWLKSEATAALIQLQLALNKIPANDDGASQMLAILQDVVNQALINGTISVGKILSITQKLEIGNISNDDTTWHQVQNIGYWLYIVMDAVNKKADYVLVYSKDDVIRKVNGTHILI